MNVKEGGQTKSWGVKAIRRAGLVGYLASLGGAIVLLVAEPKWLNVRVLAVVLAILLFVCCAIPAYYVASEAKDGVVGRIGGVAFAVLATFVGMFVIAGVGWLVALSYAQ